MESEITDDVLNIASGTETSLLELLQALLKVTGSKLEPEFLPERVVNPVSRRLACTKKAEKLLGFKAKVSIEDGLERLVKWRKELLNKNTVSSFD
jgi:UDP-glucose 4-epimerase